MLRDLSGEPAVSFSETGENLTGTSRAVLRVLMGKEEFERFRGEDGVLWRKWHEPDGEILIEVEDGREFSCEGEGLLYSVYDPGWSLGVCFVLVWRPDLGELWVFKSVMLM